MLFCEDCKNRAIVESQKLRQVDGEPARDFYIRILNHFRIWDRFYFGLRRENLGVALDAYLNGPFAVERYETTKKIKFMFISQKCSKYCNLSRFHINSFFIFFGVSYLSTAKGPYVQENCFNNVRLKITLICML